MKFNETQSDAIAKLTWKYIAAYRKYMAAYEQVVGARADIDAAIETIETELEEVNKCSTTHDTTQ